jgi:hypothetical protein
MWESVSRKKTWDGLFSSYWQICSNIAATSSYLNLKIGSNSLTYCSHHFWRRVERRGLPTGEASRRRDDNQSISRATPVRLPATMT